MTIPRRNLAFFAGGAALALTVTALFVLARGTSVSDLRAALRLTGRLGFVVFVLPFVASSLHRLMPRAATSALMRRRRDLGVAFAGVFTGHAALLAYMLATGKLEAPVAIYVLGSIGALLVYAMFATSFPALARRIGGRAWRRLHKVGVHYLALIYAYDFFGGVALKSTAVYAPLAAVLAIAYGLRVAAAIDVRSAGRATA